ncbi:hypothetical protein [Gordonia sihwensis]|uniref:hypothetical protein n=1 Tax=Gordonia sihwensis TaxID=173559 RepID=UPI003D9902B9
MADKASDGDRSPQLTGKYSKASVNDNNTHDVTKGMNTMGDTALHTDASMVDADGTYKVVASTRDVPGYVPWNTGWPTLGAARAYVDEHNAKLGLTRDEALDIIASAMRS